MSDIPTLLRPGRVGLGRRSWIILAALILGAALVLLAVLDASPPTIPAAPPQAVPPQAVARSAAPAAEIRGEAPAVTAPPPAEAATTGARPSPVHAKPARRTGHARAARPGRAVVRRSVVRDPDPIGDLLDDAAAAGMTSRPAADDSAGTPR